jgi:hypothetical protein
MTLQYIIKTLEEIALLQPNINSCGNGDIYNFINGNPQTKYSLFFVTQGTHREQNNIDYYNLNLFYLDRLTQDKKNNLRIQSTAKECLSNIIKSFCETFDVEVNSQINYTPFTETFSNDLCSGVYCNLTFEVMQDVSCAEQYGEYIKPTIQVINNQDITITDNGTYYPQNGFSGFGKVEVNVSVDDYYNRGFEEGFTQGETEGYNDGFSEGLDEGKIEGYEQGFDEGVVNGKEEQKSLLESIKITNNGVYDNENGYDVVEVDLPIQENKRVDVRYNGEYDITPDEDYTAFQRLRLNVESKPKVIIPNGVNFANSTFTEFPVEDYDWSNLYDCNDLFYNCKQLNTEPIQQAMKEEIIHPITTCGMFSGCSVKKIEGLDFTKYYGSTGMFYDITDLEEVRDCVLSDGDNLANGPHDYIYSPNSYAKVINCDWGKLTKNHNSTYFNTWYFANFKKIPTSWQYLPSNNEVSERVFVMECDKPDTLKTNSSSSIWYDDTKYNGWDSFSSSHPYGFWYKINNDPNHDKIVKITQREDITNYHFEQILPYNAEKDCYYIDYPYSMYFDVYIDNQKTPFTNKHNIENIYVPNPQVGTFEGREVGNFIDYILPNGVTLTDNGVEGYGQFVSSNIYYLLTPNQNEVEITFNVIQATNSLGYDAEFFVLKINDEQKLFTYDRGLFTFTIKPNNENKIKLEVRGGFGDTTIKYEITKITTT